MNILKLTSIFVFCLIFIVSACRKPDECIPQCADAQFICIKGDCVCPGIVLNGNCTQRLPGYFHGSMDCGCLNDLGIALTNFGSFFITEGVGTLTVDYSINEDGIYSFFYFQRCNENEVQTDYIRYYVEMVDDGMYVTTQYLTFPGLEVTYECTSFFE